MWGGGGYTYTTKTFWVLYRSLFLNIYTNMEMKVYNTHAKKDPRWARVYVWSNWEIISNILKYNGIWALLNIPILTKQKMFTPTVTNRSFRNSFVSYTLSAYRKGQTFREALSITFTGSLLSTVSNLQSPAECVFLTPSACYLNQLLHY